jgi:L-fucose isomerase-like protein
MATGALTLSPGSIMKYFYGPEMNIESAAFTPLKVKFVQTGVIHEKTYEGSCRTGQLKDLTMEAETDAMQRDLAALISQVENYAFRKGIQVLEPEGVFLWVEAGNPEIMLKSEELEKLGKDDPETDVYVVTGGLPQFTCLRIAERFKKPVILANVAGWGLDAPAGLRVLGYEGFYVQNMDHLARLLTVFKARKGIRQTRFLNLTNFGVVPKGVISSIGNIDFVKDIYGMDYHTVNYGEFFPEMDRLLKDKEIQARAASLADELIKGASAMNMTRDDVVSSFNFYLTVLHFFNKYSCNSFGVECFELCSSMNPWNRRFTPCMTHSLLKNAGFPSACEKDLSALLAMAVMMYISHKPAYMGNPDIDLGTDILTLHHSDSPTKMDGFDQPDDYFEIKSFTESGFGATLRYDYDKKKGQVVTLSRFDPSGRKILVTKGEITGGSGLDGFGCSQKVNIKVPDGREMQRKMQDFGHHLAMVFDDWTEEIRDLGVLMGFEVVLV